MDGWNTTFLLGRPIFRGYVSFREGSTYQISDLGILVLPRWWCFLLDQILKQICNKKSFGCFNLSPKFRGQKTKRIHVAPPRYTIGMGSFDWIWVTPDIFGPSNNVVAIFGDICLFKLGKKSLNFLLTRLNF